MGSFSSSISPYRFSYFQTEGQICPRNTEQACLIQLITHYTNEQKPHFKDTKGMGLPYFILLFNIQKMVEFEMYLLAIHLDAHIYVTK